MRKIISTNLGGNDDDLIKYVTVMEKKGISNSKLIKTSLRFYIAYHSSTEVKDYSPPNHKRGISELSRIDSKQSKDNLITRTIEQLNNE